jgi:DNA-binding NarL/FixJ family response regulator
MALRILLADDHVMVRQGLKALMERQGMTVVGEASDGRQAVELTRTLRPDVIVMDLAMPSLNGLAAAEVILKESPGVKVVLLTMYADDHFVLAALRVGVSGYVIKTRASAELCQAVQEVVRGHCFLSPGVSRAVVSACLTKEQLPADPLTSREKQVLQLIAEGQSTKEAAANLGISAKTAESHRTRIMRKLDIHEVAGLVRYAIRSGLTQL